MNKKTKRSILYEAQQESVWEQYHPPDEFDKKFAQHTQDISQGRHLTLQERLLLIKEKYKQRAITEKSKRRKS